MADSSRIFCIVFVILLGTLDISKCKEVEKKDANEKKEDASSLTGGRKFFSPLFWSAVKTISAVSNFLLNPELPSWMSWFPGLSSVGSKSLAAPNSLCDHWYAMLRDCHANNWPECESNSLKSMEQNFIRRCLKHGGSRNF